MAGPWEPFINASKKIVEKLPRVAAGTALDTLAVIVIGLAVSVLVYRAKQGRLPWVMPGWAATAWLAPLFTKLILSQTRFALGAWPAFIVAAESGRRWVRLARVVAAFVGVAASLILLRQWSRIQFIG